MVIAPSATSLETPRGLPLLGNMLDYKSDPLGFLAALQRRYGDVARFRLGSSDVFLLSHPDLIKEVLVKQQASFAKSRAMQQAKRVLGEGLLTSEGKHHQTQRRLMEPAFHKQQLAHYARVMVEHAERASASFVEGTIVDMEKSMLELALGVISETMFGAELAPDAEEISRALTDGMDFLMTLMLPFGGVLAKLPLPATVRFNRARALLDSTIFDIIEARKANRGDGFDLLSLLLDARDGEEGGRGMSEDQVRDEVMTIFLTGYETVGTALTWTWHLLSRHPEVQADLQAEVARVLGPDRPATFEDLGQLDLVRRVLAESMRLFPPAWAVSRRVLEDVEVGGYLIPRDSIVLLSQWITHRDERFFVDPERFDPSRWSRDGEVARRASYNYFPFGGGARGCIGERYAWTEGILMLATLARRFSVSPSTNEPPALMPLISLRPRDGMPLRIDAPKKATS